MKSFAMDKKKMAYYFRYLITRIFVFFFLYQLCMNRYIYATFYKALKESLYYQITCSEKKTNGNCLLKNPLYQPPKDSTINCLNCETLTDIRKIYYTSYSEIYTLYLKQNRPVIVIDAMFDWSVLTHPFSVKNFTEVYGKLRNQNIIPCEMSSSINWYSNNYLSDILDTIVQFTPESWFITWKNCDLTTAKIIRSFYQQPYFMKYFVPAAKINTVIAYSNYNQSNYKTFSIRGQRLLLLMQIRGSLNLKLMPIECVDFCTTIVSKLEESQILIMNSELWQLNYSPSSGTGISIVTEHDFDK